MEEDFDIMIEKIQDARSPKFFLWNLIKNLKWYASEGIADWLVGKKDGDIYFDYDIKNHTLYYSFDKIYQILSSKFHLNELKANNLIRSMVPEHFNLEVDTSYYLLSKTIEKVSEHFNLEVDTSVVSFQKLYFSVSEHFNLEVDTSLTNTINPNNGLYEYFNLRVI
jgi:hypothetical protein